MLQRISSILLLLAFGLCAQGADSVLKANFAGSWYSANPKELSASLDSWMAAAAAEDKGLPPPQATPFGLILPHAGYEYSGKVMAAGAVLLKGSDVKRVVILGPSHHVWMPEKICAPDSATAMETPLGNTPIDLEFLAKLRAMPFMMASDGVELNEHSVQMPLPMLQRALGGADKFKVVPLVVGNLSKRAKVKAAEALLSLVDDKTAIVASSDFTHFGESFRYVPFKDNQEEGIRNLDMNAFELIKRLNAKLFDAYIERTGDTICGEQPISILMRMAPKGAQVEMLKYDTSGAQMKDFSSSVSYMAVAFRGKLEAGKPMTPEEVAPVELSDADKAALLTIARKSIVYALSFGRALEPEKCGVAIGPALKKEMGAFVTLTIDGELRGCVGEIQPSRPLCEAVAERAVDAALNDSRFRPLRKEELSKIRIEISALTPPHPVESFKDIVLGKHGIILTKNGRSAVFLPQVAPEQGWDIDETLDHLSQKAGLPSGSWRVAASFSVFEATVFHE